MAQLTNRPEILAKRSSRENKFGRVVCGEVRNNNKSFAKIVHLWLWHSLIDSGRRNTQARQTRFITRFSQQHYHYCAILECHWHLLTDDSITAEYVNPKPMITYRRNKSLRDHLTESHLPKGSRSLPKGLGVCGTFRCRNCEFCDWIKVGRNIVLP